MAATEFTPLASTLGGALIGVSAVMLMLFSGRIAGISGILGRVVPPYRGSEPFDAAAYLTGVVVAPLLFTAATGTEVVQTVSGDVALMAGAGLLVGFGATVSGGCTSGHGVCGLSLLSPRSIVAVLTFMATGFATVFTVRHLIGTAI